jgi:hypothetical protein
VYLDESGDPGLKNSPTKHYILAGFSVHHGDWQALEVRLRDIHGVGRADRLLLARSLIYMLSRCPEIRTFAWVVRKALAGPVEAAAGQAMADLTTWTLDGRIGPNNPCRHAGFLILHDAAPSQPFKHIGRSDWLVGHPVGLSSRDDNMIQVADLIAYMVRQKFSPNRHALTNGYVTLCDKLLPTSLGWKQID